MQKSSYDVIKWRHINIFGQFFLCEFVLWKLIHCTNLTVFWSFFVEILIFLYFSWFLRKFTYDVIKWRHVNIFEYFFQKLFIIRQYVYCAKIKLFHLLFVEILKFSRYLSSFLWRHFPGKPDFLSGNLSGRFFDYR